MLYSRFSTPDQAKGTSLERQQRAAEQWCAAHGVTLDTTTRYHDAGKSAFKGDHAKAGGQLHALIGAVESGVIPRGSVILLDDLDRLSRLPPDIGVHTLGNLVRAGVDVVVMRSGERFTKATLESASFFSAAASLFRSHDESARKRDLSKKNWGLKHERATLDNPMTAVTPAWLRVVGRERDAMSGRIVKPGRVEIDPERARVVRDIFKWTLDGVGVPTIAKRLHEQGVKPWGSAERWPFSYIRKILDNVAVIGDLQTRPLSADGPTQRENGALLRGVYPKVIDKTTWLRVRALRDSRQPRGRHADRADVKNILAGMARCGVCGGTVSRLAAGRSYFVCQRSQRGLCSPRRATRYDNLESVLLVQLDTVLNELPTGSAAHDEAQAERQSVEAARLHMSTAVERLVDAIEQQPDSKALRTRLRDAEAELDALIERERVLGGQLEESLGRLVESKRKDALDALHAKPVDRARLNVSLRQLVERVVIDWDAAETVIHWRHSSRTSAVRYAVPRKRRKKRVRSRA